MIDQRDIKFIPRGLAVGVGTTVDFPNNDKTFHNVFSTSEAKKFDLGLYLSAQTRTKSTACLGHRPHTVDFLSNILRHRIESALT